MILASNQRMKNLGSRKRALQLLKTNRLRPLQSLPSRERGLKHCRGRPHPRVVVVAPFTGAWIETSSLLSM